MLDEARESYHDAVRERGDASDAALVRADRKLLIARGLLVPREPIDAETAKKIVDGLDEFFRGAAKPSDDDAPDRR
jgi:hypothetical protein